ncbi:FUSC family protein [Aquamicrobium segne]|uniref:FUSC family protein n=1 Tax=Aquamicrobium segne TaxID=469547 RepID=A0ABW0GTK1_9HYPH
MVHVSKNLLEYFLLSDPGYVRLRLACRALLTIGLVCGALVLLHRHVPMTPAAYSIAMISALQGITAIKDTTPATRALTRLYCAAFGFCALAVLTLIDHSLLLVNGFLLVVIFMATYARRFKARWQAVGMFTFMCAVVGAFLKPHEIDLKSIALAFVVSGVIAHLVRNFVLPERPEVDCRQALQVATRLTVLLSDMMAREAKRNWPQSGRKKAIQLERQARDAILLCESYLPLTPSGTLANERTVFALRRLFNFQLTLENALASALGPDEIHSGQFSADMQEKISLLKNASDAAHQAVAGLPAAAFSGADDHGAKVAFLPHRGEFLSDKTFRQACQVTIASAIAMVGGVALSPERWFWAVLTAFLIFSNTRSRGDLYVRALNRAFGTAIGILIGIGLATWVGGALDLTIILATICIFAAFYLGSLSYFVMTFFITIAIALIYGLIGVFTPALLVLRLEETMIGVAAGVFVSLFVLPLSTTRHTGEAVAHFLETLDLFLKAVLSGDDHANLVAAVRKLEMAQADVVAAIGPMHSPWTFGLAQARPRRALIRISMLVHQAHILVREFAGTAPDRDAAVQLDALRLQLAGLAEGHCDLFGRSLIADMARRGESATSPSKKPAGEALEVMAHILRQVDQRNQQ